MRGDAAHAATARADCDTMRVIVAATGAALAAAKASLGWPADGKVLGLHVRMGDACAASEMARTSRRCDALEAYAPHVERLAARYGVRHVFLATDSDEPGQALSEELARRLGRERCWRVKRPRAKWYLLMSLLSAPAQVVLAGCILMGVGDEQVIHGRVGGESVA